MWSLDWRLEDVFPGFSYKSTGGLRLGGSTYLFSLGRSNRLDATKDGPEFIVVAETSTEDNGTARIRAYASVEEETLRRVAVEKDEVYTVPSRGHEVRSRRVKKVGALELSSVPLPSPAPEDVTKALLQAIRSLGGVDRALLQTLPGKKRVEIERLRNRVRLAGCSIFVQICVLF
mmetsp:Transcript_10554/g.21070  ORF Transcript_10554/g.21070 Transcript_10554/m.21070 type:complete len:175 (-) Transcript_10554:45-569(-)